MEAPCSLTTKTCTGRSNCWCVTKFSVSAGSSVTDGDGLYLVSFNHFAEFRSRFGFLVYRRVRIDVFIVYQIALCIEADHLTTGTKAGIDTHYPFLSQGWGKKQLA